MSTSCGPGCGMGTRRSLRTAGDPKRSMATAFIIARLDSRALFARPRCLRERLGSCNEMSLFIKQPLARDLNFYRLGAFGFRQTQLQDYLLHAGVDLRRIHI